MQQRDLGKCLAVEFDNLLDMVRHITDAPRLWRAQDSHRERPCSDWDDSVGYDGALRLARDGWEQGVRNLSALAAAVPNDIVVSRAYSVAGEMPDVPRYLAGDPYNMVHRRRAATPKPAMRIVINAVASAGVTAAEFMNYGAAMVALVDRLESRRVRVELTACFTISLRNNTANIYWTVKRAEDQLDLSAVAFSLGHPAMLRRLGFAAMERLPACLEVPSYGYPITAKPGMFLEPMDDALIVQGIGCGMGACRTMAGALELAKRQINEAYKALGYDEPLAELEAA